MTEQEREHSRGVYVTIETVSYAKKASELSIISMAKWLEQYLPGIKVAKHMKEGKLLTMAKMIEIAQKATKYGTRFYDECEMRVTIMDSMKRCQGIIFGRTLLTVTTEQIQEELL
jgi:hypothetical protein